MAQSAPDQDHGRIIQSALASIEKDGDGDGDGDGVHADVPVDASTTRPKPKYSARARIIIPFHFSKMVPKNLYLRLTHLSHVQNKKVSA